MGFLCQRLKNSCPFFDLSKNWSNRTAKVPVIGEKRANPWRIKGDESFKGLGWMNVVPFYHANWRTDAHGPFEDVFFPLNIGIFPLAWVVYWSVITNFHQRVRGLKFKKLVLGLAWCFGLAKVFQAFLCKGFSGFQTTNQALAEMHNMLEKSQEISGVCCGNSQKTFNMCFWFIVIVHSARVSVASTSTPQYGNKDSRLPSHDLLNRKCLSTLQTLGLLLICWIYERLTEGI